MKDWRRQRQNMVARQLQGRGISDERLLDAMRDVPRECFVDEALRDMAYEDGPLPIGAGQTISQPYIVARMLEAAAIGAGDRILEVGSGSGYVAAIASRMACAVYAIDRHPQLVETAQERLTALGYHNIFLKTADGCLGWPANAPFDAIIVSAGGEAVPEPLKRQLKIGGRLLMPVGGRAMQQLLKLTRIAQDKFVTRSLDPVRFVPLVADADRSGPRWESNAIDAEPATLG